MHRILSPRPLDGRKICILDGMGGIGKTQLAVEYAYRCEVQSKSTSIFWINAKDMNTVHDSGRSILENIVSQYVKAFGPSLPNYTRISTELGCQGGINLSTGEFTTKFYEGQFAWNVVKRWLSREENKDWLLIVDLQYFQE